MAFQVKYARTDDERTRGLMNVRHLDADAGMLFLFGTPQSVSFWMHNTLIPLDMVFLDRAGRVTRIAEKAKPMDDTPIFGGDKVFAVLEVNGGAAAHAGLRVGAQMRAGVMPQSAALWRCDAR
nr:DUF192 domain-containing protein [Acidimangrovimonas sediminis]